VSVANQKRSEAGGWGSQDREKQRLAQQYNNPAVVSATSSFIFGWMCASV